MEKVRVFTHRLLLALRLVDTTSGRNVSGRDVQLFVDGKPVPFSEKEDQLLIFQELEARQFRMEITSRFYERTELQIDLDALDKTLPLLEIHLIPGENSLIGGLLSLIGVLPGIQELSAVRMGDNACLIREFDPRRRTAKIFNPHHLSLDRVQYALVDPDRCVYEPFRILRMADDQTLKSDRILEMPFKNYFPVTPMVSGITREDGSYCLRVRDDTADARWIVRWVVNGQEQFRTINFRETEQPRLEEGGG